ncbi:MAG: hypothetical protein KGJ62_14525 [Armatimonadetes bacterium]|nr:hypothetical protein [Armatimonadota bacterium]
MASLFLYISIPAISFCIGYRRHWNWRLATDVQANAVRDAVVALGRGADPNCRALSGRGTFFGYLFDCLLDQRFRAQRDVRNVVCWDESAGITRVLLNDGADMPLHCHDRNGYTPLEAATGNEVNTMSGPAVALELMSHMAHPAAADPLAWYFALTTDPSVAALFVAHGADPNAPVFGKSPLAWAAENCMPSTVALLLRKGADPTAHDAGGVEVLEGLTRYDGDRSSAQYTATRRIILAAIEARLLRDTSPGAPPGQHK